MCDAGQADHFGDAKLGSFARMDFKNRYLTEIKRYFLRFYRNFSIKKAGSAPALIIFGF